MKKISKVLTCAFCFLTGCSGVSGIDYKDETPKMDIREYLNGNLKVSGIFEDLHGKVIKRFDADLKGRWHGNSGTLEEHFTYYDGKKQDRVWNITMVDEHNFTATAADVVGIAKGEQYGNIARLQYVLEVTQDNGKKINVSMDDWIHLLHGGIALNHAKMSKFGIHVGDLIVTFKKDK